MDKSPEQTAQSVIRDTQEPWNIATAMDDLSEITSEDVLQAIIDGKSFGATKGHKVAAGRLLDKLKKAKDPIINILEQIAG